MLRSMHDLEKFQHKLVFLLPLFLKKKYILQKNELLLWFLIQPCCTFLKDSNFDKIPDTNKWQFLPRCAFRDKWWKGRRECALKLPSVSKYTFGGFSFIPGNVFYLIYIVRQDKRMGLQNEHMRRADWQKRKVRVERERSREGLRMRVEDATWVRGGWKCHLMEEDLLLPPLRAGEVLSKTFVNFSGFNMLLVKNEQMLNLFDILSWKG